MKRLILYLLPLLGISSACSNFENINTNSEDTKKVTSQMIATRIILNLTQQPDTKGFLQPYMLNKNIVWTEFVESYQYNGFGEGALRFTSINDMHFMPSFATNEKLSKSYEGLMYFARAVKFFETTMKLGDIPYHDAVKGEESKLFFPKFDTQKEVLLGVLKELEQADASFALGDKFEGDPVYKGNPQKWRQLVNSYTLHVLMQLSKKESDVELHIKDRFKSILASKPIFTSNADNHQLTHTDKNAQQYPFYKVGNNFTIYPIISSEIVDRLKERKDRRVFYYAHPSPVKLKNGFTQSDFEAYVGIDPSLIYDQILDIKNTNDYSKFNNRYTEIAAGEPTQKLSYAQLCFIIAEAAARGWITESTLAWFQKGVRASMEFIYSNTPNDVTFHHNMPLDKSYVDAYVDALTLPAALDQQVEEIITQKYLASYLQSEFNTYYDYRRTGFPKWKINAASSLNSQAPTKVPLRWKYPSDEFSYNTKNVDDAVKRQFNGVDDINQAMWLLK